MAEPVVGTPAESTSTATDPIVVNMPASRPEGDFFLMVIGRDDDNYTMDTPATWTVFDNTLTEATGDNFAIFWKIGQASEPATYSVTTNDGGAEQARMVVIPISGIDTVDTLGAVSVKNQGGSSSTATATAVTAEQSDSLILRIYAAESVQVSSFSAGTEVIKNTDGGGGVCSYGIARESSPGASTTTGSATATLDASGFWVGWTMEVRSATSSVNTDILVPTGPLR